MFAEFSLTPRRWTPGRLCRIARNLPKFAGWEYNMHIMGLADRLKAYRAEQASRQSTEAEAARKASQDAKKKLQLAAVSEQQRLQEVAEQHRKRFQPFEDLLDESGATEHLQAIRRHWKNFGQIDTEPKERSGRLFRLGLYEDFVRGIGLELNLQHEFKARFVRNTPRSDASGDYLDTVYEAVDEPMLLGLSIMAYTPEGIDQRNIRASYFAKYKKSRNNYGFEGLAVPTFQYPVKLGTHCWRGFPPESLDSNTLSFPPSNIGDSKDLLENLLFGLVKEIDLAEASPVHLSKYRAQPALPWYRRILG